MSVLSHSRCNPGKAVGEQRTARTPLLEYRSAVGGRIRGITLLALAYVTLLGPVARADGPKPPRTDRHGDPLPERALARLGSARFQHNGVPPAVAFSPDGKLLAVAPREPERSIFLWDFARGRAIHHLGPSSASIIRVAFTPDGRLLAVVSERGVTFWDVASGRRHPQAFGAGVVVSFAVAPDSKTVAVGGDLRRGGVPCVVLWDLVTGKELRALTGHQTPVHALAFSADGKRLTSCSIHVAADQGLQRGRVVVWQVPSGKRLREADMPAASLTYTPAEAPWPLFTHKAIHLAPHGDRLAFADATERIRVWDIADDRQLAEIDAGTSGFAISPDGKQLATGGTRPVKLWSVASGTVVRQFDGRRPHGTFVQAFSPDGKRLASAGTYFAVDSAVHVWDVASGKEVLPTAGHQEPVTCLAFTADGKGVVTGSADRTVRLWDTLGKELRQLRAAGGEPFAVAISPGRTRLAAVQGNGDTEVWDLNTGGSERVPRFGAAPAVMTTTGFGGATLFTPDGDALLVVRQDRTLTRRAWRGNNTYRVPAESEGVLRSAAFSPDGSLAAGAWVATGRAPDGFTLTARGGFGLWDATSGALRWKNLSPTAPGVCLAVAFSPDGGLVAFSEARVDGSEVHWTEQAIRVFESATGRLVRQLPLRDGPASGLAFAPDGRTLLAVHGAPFGTLGEVVVWDVAAGKEVRRLKGHAGPIACVAWAPDGKRFATGAADNTILIWDGTDLLPPAMPRPRPWSVQEQAALWQGLVAPDATAAHRIMWELAANPAEALSFFKQYLRPASPLAAEQLAQLVRDLGSGRFAVREKATEALRLQGRQAEPALRAALMGMPPLETKRRLELLLAKLERAPLPPEQVRLRRGVTVLEWLGTAEARRVLESLARGGEGLLLTQEARAALRRLERRAGDTR